jgi:hypothetical protein
MKLKNILILTLACTGSIFLLTHCKDKTETKNASQVETPKKRTGNPSIDLWTDVKEAEMIMYKKKESGQINVNYYKSYFNCLIAFYTKYPNDPRADSCLMAICVTPTEYPLGQKNHFNIQEQYGDTLLKKYPKSRFRIPVLQNLILVYDQTSGERDVEKIKKYINLLLSELPNDSFNEPTRKEFEERLKNIDEPAKIPKATIF